MQSFLILLSVRIKDFSGCDDWRGEAIADSSSPNDSWFGRQSRWDDLVFGDMAIALRPAPLRPIRRPNRAIHQEKKRKSRAPTLENHGGIQPQSCEASRGKAAANQASGGN